MSDNTLEILIYVLVFISTLLIIDGIARYISSKKTYNVKRNKRLKILDKTELHEDALLELRRQRGLGSEGEYILPIVSFNRLILQSGVSIGSLKLIVIMLLLMTASFAIVFYFDRAFMFPSIASVCFGIILPIIWLSTLRRWRRQKIESQLPEALDVLRRSLNAGHPLSVAIALVARELPDPIGSEFGLASDEMTYGLDLEDALANMGARIGQADMSLVVISVSIQSKTGGNLIELLTNLTTVIRDRQTLRRKVKAISAEGRFSAFALSLLPILLFITLLLIAPSFYGDVWGHPLIKPVLGFACVFMFIGDIVMYRMVNFRF